MSDDDQKKFQEFERQLLDYRKALQDAGQRMQTQYDTAIMALSGGALGVSMTFLKDIVLAKGVHNGVALLIAWSCWGASVTCILISFYSSVAAFRKAVDQLDEKTIYVQKPGGTSDCATKVLNFLAGLFFVLGVIFIVVFAASNLP
jgi:preprotein translocase subunit SecY